VLRASSRRSSSAVRAIADWEGEREARHGARGR
jgi:hypothetical protein